MKDVDHRDMWALYQQHISQGCLTNSKHVDRHPELYPKIISDGFGAKVWCYENGQKKEYISYDGALGASLYGHGNPLIHNMVEARRTQLLNSGLNGYAEVEAAMKLKEYFPFVEKFKFLRTGSGACSAAVRFARAHTGRDLILSDGYHGFHDMFVSLTPPATGVPKDKNIEKFTDFSQVNTKVAALILEPVMLDASRERMRYLQQLREVCDENGVLLIFDEVITGLRFKEYSVTTYSGVTPDLIVLGKAIGGGMALSAVGGPAKIMDNPQVFISTTFAGETLPLIYCTAALTALRKYSDFNLEDLWLKGDRFMKEFNKMGGMIQIVGYPTRGAYKYTDLELFTTFRQEAARAGILIGNSHFYDFPHPEHDDMVLSTLEMIFKRLYRKEYKLVGKLPTSPFSTKQRGKNAGTRKKSTTTKRRRTGVSKASGAGNGSSSGNPTVRASSIQDRAQSSQ